MVTSSPQYRKDRTELGLYMSQQFQKFCFPQKREKMFIEYVLLINILMFSSEVTYFSEGTSDYKV